jgi:RimJ/RimL family protein N-acetyltransferase
MKTMAWPVIESVEAGRLRLEALTVDHAVSMVDVLSDGALYQYIGGQPPTVSELRLRYAAQAVGHSEDQSQWWLNWIVSLRDSACAVGYVQATVEQASAGPEASIAWVIAPAFQGRGLATEAASAMVDWLSTMGVDHLVAYVHPAHAASQAVARRLGLHPTSAIEDGEVCWRSHSH